MCRLALIYVILETTLLFQLTNLMHSSGDYIAFFLQRVNTGS